MNPNNELEADLETSGLSDVMKDQIRATVNQIDELDKIFKEIEDHFDSEEE